MGNSNSACFIITNDVIINFYKSVKFTIIIYYNFVQKASKFVLYTFIDHHSQNMPGRPIFLWKWALHSPSMAM
jgi:hypothetical protein